MVESQVQGTWTKTKGSVLFDKQCEITYEGVYHHMMQLIDLASIIIGNAEDIIYVVGLQGHMEDILRDRYGIIVPRLANYSDPQYACLRQPLILKVLGS